MDRPSNHWQFKLTEEGDVFLRLGIHGLYRLLAHGEGAENFSTIKQSKTLQWELDTEANTIDLWWEAEDDLSRLLQGMWGDYSGGLITNPGYEHDPDKDGAYVTARFHGAVAGYFSTGPGKKRSQSSGKRVKLDHLLLPFNDKKGESIPWEISFTAHTHPPEKSKLVFQNKKRGMSSTLHPALTTWHGESLTCTAEQGFLLSFSCLAYIFTYCTDGYVGLGIDLPSFAEADAVHRRWSFSGSENSGRAILTIAGKRDTALWVMAVALGLDGTFSAIYQPEPRSKSTGHKMFNTRLPGRREQRLRELVPQFFQDADASARFLRTLNMPLRSYEKGGRMVTMESVLDRVIHNLTHGFRWFAGMHEYPSKTNNRPTKKHEQKLLLNLCQGDPDMDLVEQEVCRKFRNLYYGVALQEAERVRGPKAAPKPEDYEHAERVVVRTELNRANNTASILRAINNIKRVSKTNLVWTADQQEYLITMARQDPITLKAILVLSTMTNFNLLTDQEVQKRAEKLAFNNDDNPSDDNPSDDNFNLAALA
jgi:hypothetical protein